MRAYIFATASIASGGCSGKAARPTSGGGFVADWTIAGEPGEYLGYQLVSAGDLDHDGRAELVAVAADGYHRANGTTPSRPPKPGPPRLVLLEASEIGPPRRTEIVTLASWSPALTLAAGDVDGDGARDVAIAGIDRSDEFKLEIRRGQGGTIAAAPTWTYSIPAAQSAFVFVDDDGDGDTDLWWSDQSRAPRTLVRWSAGKDGLDGAAAVVRPDPTGNRQSWFGQGIIAAPFTRADSVEVAVTAHGDRRAYVYRLDSTEPDRVLESRDIAPAVAAAIDLEGDGVAELAFFNEMSVVVFARAHGDTPVVRYGP